MKKSDKEKLFINMFNENREKTYRLCYAYLYDKTEIDDLFQEIMVNVWNSLDKFRHESKISTWVYRIAINTALLFNKKTAKKNDLFLKMIPDSQFAMATPSHNSESDINESIKQLHQCINKLEKQDRIIISLVLEGLKYEEIAEVLGLTASHVGVKINRIKPVLLKLMKEVQNG